MAQVYSNRWVLKERPSAGSGAVCNTTFTPASKKELKALGDDLPAGYVAGWASTKDLDHSRHVVMPGAFDESIERKGLTGPNGVKLLISHKPDRPAGVIKVLETRGDRLWIEAELNLRISYVRDMYEAAMLVGGFSFSVGFLLDEFVWKEEENYLQILKADLFEISIVTMPDNENSGMTFIKEAAGLAAPQAPRLDTGSFGSLAEFEKALVAAGFARSRNHASQIVKAVKRNAELFQPAPVADDLATKRVKGALADLRGILKNLKGEDND